MSRPGAIAFQITEPREMPKPRKRESGDDDTLSEHRQLQNVIRELTNERPDKSHRSNDDRTTLQLHCRGKDEPTWEQEDDPVGVDGREQSFSASKLMVVTDDEEMTEA